MIIPNEKEYVEELLIKKQKPSNVSVKGLIRYIAKYYYEYCDSKGMNLNQYTKYVLEVIRHFKIPKIEYQEYRYAKFTKTYCRNLMSGIFSHDLREVDTITITQDELDIINSAVYRKERKVLFGLYALAKIYSPDTGWINSSEADIFKASNVTVSYKERMQILHALYKDELIDINHMIDKSGYHVHLMPDSPVVFRTNILRDFGNQYIVLMDSNLKMCPKCGRPYRPKDESECCTKCRCSVEVRE